MRKMIGLIIFPIFLFVTSAGAGQLGSCKRCVSGSGVETHLWDFNYFGIGLNSSFCESAGLQSGGDGDPLQCDQNAKIFRWTNNDPFRLCPSDNSSQSVYIGGENNDLIVISENGASFSSGTFFRIQDGSDYQCGVDVQSGSNFTALRYGVNRDIIDIFSRAGKNVLTRQTFRIQDGINQLMVVNVNGVARRFGRSSDLMEFYGVTEDGSIVVHRQRIQDGGNHLVDTLSSTDFGVTWGRNKDWRGRFCFSNDVWTVKLPTVLNQPYPNSC